MLIIRKEQMDVFEAEAVRSFEARVAEHLKKKFPKHCEAMGDEALTKVVESGRERAATYGLQGERSVRLYLELMLMLGSGFDQDPQLPWAAAALGNRELGDESARIDALYRQVGEFAIRTAGPNNEYLNRTLSALPEERPEGYVGSGASNFEDYMLHRLTMLYPEKVEAVGREPLRVLIRRGVAGARRTGLTTEPGVILYVCLMFFLGAGFDGDPQFKWAADILNDKTLEEPDKKAARLREAATAFLKRFLA